MGLFGARKERKLEEQRRREREARRMAEEAEERARIERLYQKYEEIKEEDRLESERRVPLMDYPTVAFTEESLDWWLGVHIDMDKYAALPVVNSFKKSVLDESKSFRDLGPLLVELSELVERGEMDAKASKWFIRAFVASYDIQNNGEYSPSDVKLAEHYHAVLQYLDSSSSKASDAYLYLGEPAAKEVVFDAVDQFLQTVYYGKGLRRYAEYPCFSGLRYGGEFTRKPLNMTFAPPSDSSTNTGKDSHYILSVSYVSEDGAVIDRPITEKEDKHPRYRWDDDVNSIFGGDRYRTASVYYSIAAIYAHSYGWRDKEVRIGRMKYCQRNMGESRVNAMLVYWVSRHPEWKIIQKDCIGPYSDKCIRLSSSGRGPQEIDHLLVGPYGVIQVETKNYRGYISILTGGKTHCKIHCTPFESSKSHEVEGDPIEQVRSHDITLRRILGDIPLHSIICISSPGSVIKNTPEEIAKISPYDIIDYVTLDDYLTQMQHILAAKTHTPYDVDEVVRKIENAKVRDLLRGESAEYEQDPSVLSADMPSLR